MGKRGLRIRVGQRRLRDRAVLLVCVRVWKGPWSHSSRAHVRVGAGTRVDDAGDEKGDGLRQRECHHRALLAYLLVAAVQSVSQLGPCWQETDTGRHVVPLGQAALSQSVCALHAALTNASSSSSIRTTTADTPAAAEAGPLAPRAQRRGMARRRLL